MPKDVIIGILKATAIVALVFCVFVLLIYLTLLGGSHVYVSGGLSTILGYTESGFKFPLWSLYREALDWKIPGLNQFGPITVERVDASHALRNIIFIFSLYTIGILMPVVIVLFAVSALVTGIFTANWNGFVIGILGFAYVPLSFIFFVIVLIVAYFALLFQPCTPGYVVLWLTVGLASALLGPVAAAPPLIIVIKIYR